MAFIDTIPPREAEGDVRAMYERQQAAYGYVPNYAKVFCYRPEIMPLWAELQSGIRKHVDRRRFELVTFAAAHAMNHSYCSLAHATALMRFFSPDEIRALLPSAAPGPVTEAEAAMMAYARKIVRDASTITAEDVAGLERHGFTSAEIFDIAAIAAARAFFAKLIDALGAEPDVTYLEMDEALRESLTVGRSIDRETPEQVAEAAA
jgi:uncharacterized peroxidase-related enzyme